MMHPECTGFENRRGACWWCGGELLGRQRRYCAEDCGEHYRASFYWSYARGEALRRTGGLCARCPKRAVDVHHIDPLVGPRATNVGNRQENLMPLCRSHHRQAQNQLRLAPRRREEAPQLKFREMEEPACPESGPPLPFPSTTPEHPSTYSLPPAL